MSERDAVAERPAVKKWANSGRRRNGVAVGGRAGAYRLRGHGVLERGADERVTMSEACRNGTVAGPSMCNAKLANLFAERFAGARGHRTSRLVARGQVCTWAP